MTFPGIIDPRLMMTLGGFYTCTAEVQQLPTPDQQNADGEALRSTWSTVPGLTGISCRVTAIQTRKGDEPRANYTVYEDANYYIELAGWFPTVRMKMRLVVSGPKRGLSTTYDIKGVQFDPMGTYTKVFGEVLA